MNYKKIVKFVLVGGCSTAIDFVIYMLLSTQINISIAKLISMICASVFSYILNKRFTFQNKDKTKAKHIVSFYLVFFANLVVNVGMNKLMFSISENKLLSFTLATICGMTVSYLGQRFFVFNVKKP